MTLNKFTEEVLSKIEEGVKEALAEGWERGCATVDTNDGYLDICYDIEAEKAEVIVYHDDESKYYNDCCNLADYLEEYIQDNIEVSTLEEELEEEAYHDDVWHRNGFENEADYIRYRYA